jgi:hypothetical protein
MHEYLLIRKPGKNNCPEFIQGETFVVEERLFYTSEK